MKTRIPQSTQSLIPDGARPAASCAALAAAFITCVLAPAFAHVVPPEKLHPVAEAYQRVTFLLNLNPVVFEQVRPEVQILADHLKQTDPAAGANLLQGADDIIRKATLKPDSEKGIERLPRAEAAAQVFTLLTRAVPALVRHHLKAAEQQLDERERCGVALHEAQGIWMAFDRTIAAADRPAHRKLGECWLELNGALGSPGLLGVGAVPADRKAFREESAELLGYLDLNYGVDFAPVESRPLAPWPAKSRTFDVQAMLPVRLPPGHNINKQVNPRPRQILNLVARGVDETETPLIALGDMAFDSPQIFGEPARSLGISCNTCHNKSITNPQLFIPGLSKEKGGLDVSSSFFAPHANNGHFDPLDVPDLRGIRFTAPYGRNGRFESLREFTRNVVVNEFNGPEPDPIILDGMLAYMLEFDFLPNANLNKDGTLKASAPAAGLRGEKIFNRPFASMNGQSCASCHIPSANFVDHKRHDIGTVSGCEDDSRDRALDTPTLLSARWTQPYFHDGSQPTLHAVNQWFNRTFQLDLNNEDLNDLTAYVEIISDGVDPYEEPGIVVAGEMQEQFFFLSSFEMLREKGKKDVATLMFRSVADEIRNEATAAKDPYQSGPVFEQLAVLMDEAHDQMRAGNWQSAHEKVKIYRGLYTKNVAVLQ